MIFIVKNIAVVSLAIENNKYLPFNIFVNKYKKISISLAIESCLC